MNLNSKYEDEKEKIGEEGDCGWMDGLTLSLPRSSPVKPSDWDWSKQYPELMKKDENCTSNTVNKVEFADIGCGYGGLLGTD